VERTSDLEAPTMKLEGHKDEVLGIAFSADGLQLASCSSDKTVCTWNVFGPVSNKWCFTGHKHSVLDVCWSPDNTHIFSGDASGHMFLWDASVGYRKKNWLAHTSAVNALASGAEGITYSVGNDSFLKQWDIRSRKSAWQLKGNQPWLSVVNLPSLHSVLISGVDGTLHLIDVRRPMLPEVPWRGNASFVSHLTRSPTGSFVGALSLEGMISIWNVLPFTGAEDNHNNANENEHGNETDDDRCINEWSLGSAGALMDGSLQRCDWGQVGDAEYLTAGTKDGLVNVWRPNGELVYQLPGHRGVVYDVALHPTQPIVASGSGDKTILVGELAAPVSE
jgi:Prp8 binding protein